MPSITVSPTIAENLPINEPDATNWFQPEAVLASDDQHTMCDFLNSVELGVSNYLYAHGFDLNLPSGAVINGISASVERSGMMSIEDYYVGLVYPDGEDVGITSPGKQMVDVEWPVDDEVATYGGEADTWNHSWTTEETNDTAFGFVISAEGDASYLEFAQIDHISLTIYYTESAEDHVPEGGVECGGEADSWVVCNVAGSGGADLNGSSIIIDGFIVTGGLLASGGAFILNTEQVSGGVMLGGASLITDTDNVQGGLETNGAADVSVVFQAESSSGVHVAGNSDFQIRVTITSTANVFCGAEATIATIYHISDPVSGIEVGGWAIPGIQPPVGGGAINGGEVDWIFLAVPPITGGARVSGSHIFQQTYAAQEIDGGVYASGQARKERLKYYVSEKVGRGRAMASENILNTDHSTSSNLIDPFRKTQPALRNNQFRLEPEPGWCDFGESCGDGYLPEIVKKRQTGYLPPKSGRTRSRTSQIATMD